MVNDGAQSLGWYLIERIFISWKRKPFLSIRLRRRKNIIENPFKSPTLALSGTSSSSVVQACTRKGQSCSIIMKYCELAHVDTNFSNLLLIYAKITSHHLGLGMCSRSSTGSRNRLSRGILPSVTSTPNRELPFILRVYDWTSRKLLLRRTLHFRCGPNFMPTSLPRQAVRVCNWNYPNTEARDSTFRHALRMQAFNSSSQAEDHDFR